MVDGRGRASKVHDLYIQNSTMKPTVLYNDYTLGTKEPKLSKMVQQVDKLAAQPDTCGSALGTHTVEEDLTLACRPWTATLWLRCIRTPIQRSRKEKLIQIIQPFSFSCHPNTHMWFL